MTCSLGIFPQTIILITAVPQNYVSYTTTFMVIATENFINSGILT